jgi:Flp pilus assembly protein TadG
MARSARSRRRRGDGGEVSLQVVLLTPVLLLLVLVVAQAALWYNAVQLADNAASDGASAAARRGAGADAGVQEAMDMVTHDAGGRLAGVPVVRVGPTDVVATVSVHVPHVIPGWPSSVTRTAHAPRERLTRPGG